MFILALIFFLFFFIVILAFLITIHEYGHYIVAKKSGAHVFEFSVGMGPILYQREDHNGTMWSIRWFPFGGYVLTHSDSVEYFINVELGELENISEEELRIKEKELSKYSLTINKVRAITSEQNMDNKKLPNKLLFSMGGILMNLLVVWAGLFVMYKVHGKKTPTNIAYLVQHIDSSNTNEAIQIKSAVLNKEDTQLTVSKFDDIDSRIFDTQYDSITLTVDFRSESNILFLPNGKDNNGDYEYLATSINGDNIPDPLYIELTEQNLIQSAYYQTYSGWKLFVESFEDTFIYLWKSLLFLIFLIIPSYQLQTNEAYIINSEEPTFIENTSLFVNNQLQTMVYFSSLLLVFNILPIPPLDGFHFGLYLYEGITKKKVSPKTQAKISKVGWSIIMILTIWMFFVPLLK